MRQACTSFTYIGSGTLTMAFLKLRVKFIAEPNFKGQYINHDNSAVTS